MIDFKDIRVKVKEISANSAEFEITPIPRGYGHTLANSLRRILLSSIEGAAVTSVKIAGIDHEYTTIDGMKEDVVELLLNIKGLRFNSQSDTPQICYLDLAGKKEVTGGDISVSGPVEVVNKDWHLATLTNEDSKLSIEIVVERGVGYKPAIDVERTEQGRIPLDADFSPVKKVSFDVVSARKGQETDLDGVIMSVITDESLSPTDAMLGSARILQEFAGKVMAALGVPITDVEDSAKTSQIMEAEAVAAVDSVSEEVKGWKVEDLPISKRSKSGLLAGGFDTLGDLSTATATDLLNLPGFGNKSLSEVMELLSQYNIELKS